MRTNIVIDEQLIGKARRLSRLKTKKEIVTVALEEFIRHLQQKQLLELRGKVKWTGNLEKMRTDK